MNVLYIIPSGVNGGTKVAFIDMIRIHKTMGVFPIVLTVQKNEINELLDEMNIPNYAINYKMVLQIIDRRSLIWPLHFIKAWLNYKYYNFRLIRRIESFVDFKKIDIIHSNLNRIDVGCSINKKHHIPHVMHVREFADDDFGCISLDPMYIKKFNKYTSKFIAVSDAVNVHWQKKGLCKEKIQTIYDGVRHTDINVASMSKKEDHPLKLVIVGGISAPKGQMIAVKAISRLPASIIPNVSLDIIGWGDPVYIEEIKNYSKENGIDRNIRFLGTRNDIHNILSDYHVGLMCSKSEGFGLVTAEYMHAALGVIASDSGSCPELIDNMETGLLFRVNDSEDLSSKIKILYENRVLLKKISENARKKAERSYTAELNAKNVYRLFQELIQ